MKRSLLKMETKDKSILKKKGGRSKKAMVGQGEQPGDRLMVGWLLEDSPTQSLAVYLSPGSFALQIFSAQRARNTG